MGLIEFDECNEQNLNHTASSINENNTDDENDYETNTSFKDWSQSIVEKSRFKVK